MPTDFEPNVLPHGNSKSDRPFFPTLPSTMMKIKEECNVYGPKKVVCDISSDLGGIINASDSCELSRSEQQVSQAKRRLKKKQCAMEVGGNVSVDDELSVVMHKAFMEDESKQFIRDVKALREPAVVVACDYQLNDLVHFCTSDKFGVMTIDPTFTLGDFDVTIITYRHLMLECRRSGTPPALIGPVLIHYRKSFSSYLFFASTLVGLQPSLSNVRCFGTDGETALYEAFKHTCPASIHLICCIHVRRNIISKLTDLGIKECYRRVIIEDIFGKKEGTHMHEGLIDAANSKEYENGLKILQKKWKNMMPGDSIQSFNEWFLQYKSRTIEMTLLKEVRIKAGLGDPPSTFSTNASESMNAMLKNKVNYKKNELPAFLDKLKEVIGDQEKEIERALIDRGKYRLCSDFKSYQQDESKWFLNMSQTQKERVVKKFMSDTFSICSQKSVNRTLFPITDNVVVKAPAAIPSRDVLSVRLDEKINISSIILAGIERKAIELLNEADSISRAPGCDKKSCMVKSFSSSKPHLVMAKNTGQYSCDNHCPNWRSLKICSHSVAAAEFNGELKKFVAYVSKCNPKPNISKLATTHMPVRRGRKGGVAPSKKKKRVKASSRTSFSDVLNDYDPLEGTSSDHLLPAEEDIPADSHYCFLGVKRVLALDMHKLQVRMVDSSLI